MNPNQSSQHNFLPWNISWTTIVLALLAIITFLSISNPDIRYMTQPWMGGGVMKYDEDSQAVYPTAVDMPARDANVSGVSAPGMPSPDYYPYPYPDPEISVTDTREFLKVNYNASMRTRDVQGLTRRVTTTVRGFNGRIDQESSSSKYGSVSFAIPQSKYDAFRTELESLVGNKFLTVDISSQNLLSQKVSIEEQQTRADTAVSDYKTARQKVVDAHTSTARSLQAKIDSDTQRLAVLHTQTQTPEVLAETQVVTDDLASLKKQLANENASYTTRLNSADSRIKYAEDWQKAVQTQDQKLLDNVATVTGTVSIQWISFWDMAQLYLPGYWIPTIFAVLTLLSFRRDRRRAVALAI